MTQPTQEQTEWVKNALTSEFWRLCEAAIDKSRIEDYSLLDEMGEAEIILATALAEREADGWRTDWDNLPNDRVVEVFIKPNDYEEMMDWQKKLCVRVMSIPTWLTVEEASKVYTAFKLITLPPAKETE